MRPSNLPGSAAGDAQDACGARTLPRDPYVSRPDMPLLLDARGPGHRPQGSPQRHHVGSLATPDRLDRAVRLDEQDRKREGHGGLGEIHGRRKVHDGEKRRIL